MKVVDIETLPVRERIPFLLSKYKQEILKENDWFYKFADYEINICDYHETGIFSVVACPIIYLNIWDDYPTPLYNKSFYESCDALLAISKQTKLINELVLGEKANKKVIEYVPLCLGKH